MAAEGTCRQPEFLVHREDDSVAIATRDLHPGNVEGGCLRGEDTLKVRLLEDVPLGHKFALVAIGAGDDVLEYGTRVAVAITAISAGQHVHVHNVRSARWQTSTAS